MSVSTILKRWRENYYFSNAISTVAKPLHDGCDRTLRQLQAKIKKNGVSLRLPNGRTLRIARNSGVGLASLLFWKGPDGFESETYRTLCFFFERCSNFVDIGANYGFYSLIAAQWNSDLHITAFEPVPEIFRGFERNIALNGLENRITAHQLALSDRSGRGTFYLPLSDSRDYESTGTLSYESWQRRRDSPSFDLDMLRFDEFERSRPTGIDIVKIDVEDFEAAVLAGMEQTILRDRPFIVCEVLPRAHKNNQTRKVLESLGYSAYWITPIGYVKVSTFDFAREFTNFLFSPVSIDKEIVTDLNLLWERRHNMTTSECAVGF